MSYKVYNQGWQLLYSNDCQCACQRSHIDVILVHDAAQVFIGGKDSVKAVIIDVSYNHLVNDKRNPELLKTYSYILYVLYHKKKIHIQVFLCTVVLPVLKMELPCKQEPQTG